MNWKIFLGFFALPLIRLLGIDCLKVTDIVNGLDNGAKYPIPQGHRLKVWRHFKDGQYLGNKCFENYIGLKA